MRVDIQEIINGEDNPKNHTLSSTSKKGTNYFRLAVKSKTYFYCIGWISAKFLCPRYDNDLEALSILSVKAPGMMHAL